MTSKDIAWVAGILEGEGHFGVHNGSPKIQLAMTDLDVVEKVRNITDSSKKISSCQQVGRKERYTLTLVGNISIQWMMTVYSLMGLRRRAKIREILHYWRNRPKKSVLLAQAQAVRMIMSARNLSREEAEKFFLGTLIKKE